MKFKIIDHTADIGIRVFGRTLEELFVNAAEGMRELVVSGKGDSPFSLEGLSPFNITALDQNQLLVKWLQEILYLIDAKNLVPVNFAISKITENNLSAKVFTTPFDPKVHEARRQIKAVTYHDLQIKKVRGRFEVSVIFDI